MTNLCANQLLDSLLEIAKFALIFIQLQAEGASEVVYSMVDANVTMLVWNTLNLVHWTTVAVFPPGWTDTAEESMQEAGGSEHTMQQNIQWEMQ